MKRYWCASLGCLAAILAARAYVQKRFRQFLADSANLKRNIAVEAMAARKPMWDEAIQDARKEAWKEGYEAAEINEHEHRSGWKLTNPYTAQRHQTHKEQK